MGRGRGGVVVLFIMFSGYVLLLGSWPAFGSIIMPCPNCILTNSQGPHSHILVMGGPKDFFGVWNFGQRGFFGVYERGQDFFGLPENTVIFWILYFSSAQINNNIISVVYCLCGIFVYVRKVGIFLNRLNKFWSWYFFGYKILTPLPPPN